MFCNMTDVLKNEKPGCLNVYYLLIGYVIVDYMFILHCSSVID